MTIFKKLLQITILIGNKYLCMRKSGLTRDETLLNEQRKENYWRKKQKSENIEERNDDDL